MNQSQDLAALVAKMPELDKHGKLDGIPWPDAVKIYDEMLKGGRESVVKLVGMLKEVDDGEDYKVRYAIHGLALYLCRPEKKKDRERFVSALLSQLGGGRPKSVQGFIVRELQVVGGKECAEPLGKLLGDDDLCDDAAAALLAIREGAAAQFRRALPAAKGRRRLVVVQALGVLRDVESAEALRKAAGEEDRETRLAAVWGLANMGDPGSAEILLKAAGAAPGWERIRGAQACLLLAERLVAAGKKADAEKICARLKKEMADPSEAYIREAADRVVGAVK